MEKTIACAALLTYIIIWRHKLLFVNRSLFACLVFLIVDCFIVAVVVAMGSYMSVTRKRTRSQASSDAEAGDEENIRSRKKYALMAG